MSKDTDLEKLENKKEVFAPADLPFEAPAKEFVPGPLYVNIEEVMPELGEETSAAADTTESMGLAVDRRDFMRLFGAGAALASTACVRRPVEKVIPYVDQPVDMVPGVPTYYATTCGECASGCGLVVKTREGIPVKIEGNPEHPLSQGATCALTQSTLQALFHPERRKAPFVRFGTNRVEDVSWEQVYDRLGEKVKGAKNVAILTEGSTGHRNDFYRDFLRGIGMPETNLYTYTANSLVAATAAAYRLAFGVNGLPRTDLRRSDLIVGVGAEFLDVGVNQVYETKSWSDGHSFRFGKLGKLIQFESRLTLTGAKAAERHPIAPGDELAVTLMIVDALLSTGSARGSAAEQDEIRRVVEQNRALIDEAKQRLGFADDMLRKVADELLASKSIVMCGGSGAADENQTQVQLAGIMANTLIGAYGKTLYFDRGWMTADAETGGIERFLADAKNIDLVIIINANPVFNIPGSFGMAAAIDSIGTVVSIQPMPNETEQHADYVLNGHHYLEAWGDEQPVAGFWSIRQPVVRPTSNSMQAEDILLWTAAKMGKPMGYAEYRDYILAKWKAVHALVDAKVDFDTFFKAVQRRGFVGKLDQRTVGALGAVQQHIKPVVTSQRGLKLVAYLDPRLIDGRGADRPVLQEVGDSLTSVTWDTWVALNPNTAQELGLRYNDVVTVEGPGGSFEAAIYPLPGLHRETVAVPRGNGHAPGISKVTTGIGVDPLVALGRAVDPLSGQPVTAGQLVKLVATGKRHGLAALQKHNDIANRFDIVKTVALESAAQNMNKTKDLDMVPDLYPKLPTAQYRWGMAIDLGKCTGCMACVVACDVENNTPQVGRDQIKRGREMHWLRLDRYFAGSVDNPEVIIQPMLCQHCNHAPCEPVCPVYATTHDPEGMNAQTYNRCIGTRYCANACPYKVRRFNWFTHKWNVIGNDPIDRNPRAMNPDVTVRTRGVMEKCTFCVQRIRDTKLAVKKRGDKLMDGELKTACQQVCPANAITFGDLFDDKSKVSRDRRDNRAYMALNGDHEHGHYGIKTVPNVSYLAKVTHGKSEFEPKNHHEPEHHGSENHGSEHHG